MRTYLLIVMWAGVIAGGFGQTIEDEVKKAQAEIDDTKPYLLPETAAGWTCLVGGTAWVIAGAFQPSGGAALDAALIGGLTLEILGGGLIALEGSSEKRITLLRDRIDYVGYTKVPDDEKLLVLQGQFRVGMQEPSFLLAAGPPMDFDTDAPTLTHRQLIYPWGSATSDRGIITSIDKRNSLWAWN